MGSDRRRIGVVQYEGVLTGRRKANASLRIVPGSDLGTRVLAVVVTKIQFGAKVFGFTRTRVTQ